MGVWQSEDKTDLQEGINSLMKTGLCIRSFIFDQIKKAEDLEILLLEIVEETNC